MDRSQRSAIIEPILLILKQRTGVATIAAIIVAAIMLYFDRSAEEISVLLVPILMYIGKQGYVDAKENGAEVVKEVVEAKEKMQQLLDLIEVFDETETPVKVEAEIKVKEAKV